uniref:Protein roadkill n=1 Tax=Macrostomum lignano TaxID=282301 RepID=A0A1I8IBW7_9PLAT
MAAGNWCGKSAENRLHRRDELLGPPGTTRMPQPPQLLTDSPARTFSSDSAQQDDIPLTCTSHASESTSSSSEVAAAGGSSVRKKPALRRLFSRESRSFVLQKEQQLQQQQQQPQQQQLQKHRTKRLQYSELVSEEAESGDES